MVCSGLKFTFTLNGLFTSIKFDEVCLISSLREEYSGTDEWKTFFGGGGGEIYEILN